MSPLSRTHPPHPHPTAAAIKSKSNSPARTISSKAKSNPTTSSSLLLLARVQRALKVGAAANSSSSSSSNMSAAGPIELPASKVCVDMSSGGGARTRNAATADSKSSTASSASNASTAAAAPPQAASKLSKIGKRLRDSCRNLRPKSGRDLKNHNPEEYTSVTAPNDSHRSKTYVAMDFTGKVGRICQNGDLNSASASVGRCYTSKDGYAYFRRRVSPREVEPLLTETQTNAHAQMPWFHRGVGRDVAQRILAAHNVDGAFLVRESSVSGGFVISYSFGGRTFHAQVLPDRDVSAEEPGQTIVFYSLDDGKTRFFDLLQMVEFYQLNRGSLNSRLTHYIVRVPLRDKQEEEEPQAGAAGPVMAAGETKTEAAAAAAAAAGAETSEGAESPKSRSDSTASEASMESQASQRQQQQQQQQQQQSSAMPAETSSAASDAAMPTDSDTDSESMREFHQQG